MRARRTDVHSRPRGGAPWQRRPRRRHGDRSAPGRRDRDDGRRHRRKGQAGVALRGGRRLGRYDPQASRRVVARLQADGDLDATATVYARYRSQQTYETCDVSDTTGRAAVGFDVRKDRSYLIRVAASRTITGARLTLAQPALTLGQTAMATVAVTPAVDGIVTFVIEQHDPLAGWLFVAAQHVGVAGGQAQAAFAVPSVGRWRIRATYDGTAGSAPSMTGYRTLSVSDGTPGSSG